MRQFLSIDPLRRIALAGAFLLIAAICGAGPALAGGVPMILPDSKAPLVVETAGGERRFSVEIADEPAERERGLMFRRSMGDDHGMLFVFSGEGDIAFWMKDTPMALDMLFIGADGRVRAIRQGAPFSEESISPGMPARFVLELRAGMAQKSGIAVGDRVRHPAIDN